MATCTRKSKSSSSRDSEGGYNYDDEDEQTRKEFDDFKKWLDENTPSPSEAAPSSVVLCKKCGMNECQ